MRATCRRLAVPNYFRNVQTAEYTVSAVDCQGAGGGKNHRLSIVHTLTEEGFLTQDPFTKQYSLGEQALVLGFVRCIGWMLNELLTIFFGSSMSAPRSAHILRFRVGIRVCVWIVWFQIVLGRLSSVFVGGVYPLFRGASNRVLLAFASSQFQSNYLNSLELAEEEKAQLKEDLKDARARGYDITHNS